MKKCNTCFWNNVSLELWSDFEGNFRSKLSKDQQITEIKTRKCDECKKGQENYSQVWKCKNCGIVIDGHHQIYHSSLCEKCWNNQ